MSTDVIDELVTNFRRNETIMKAVYFLFSMRFAYYEVWKIENILEENSNRDIILPALAEIEATRKQCKIDRKELIKYLWEVEPYLAYLLDETEVETPLVILSFLQKELDIVTIFTVPLENLPEFADEKYGIVLLNDECTANHQGIFFDHKFYYYSPLVVTKRDAKFPPELINLLLGQLENNNSVFYRLDNNLSIDKHSYKPFYRELSEVYQGREINLDNINFPLHTGKNEYFCVYNPKTMKKIQFKISYRKDEERWIEVEELWDIHGRDEQEYFVTRYLHSIYEPTLNAFVHVDGSINIYRNESYKLRISQQISAHADWHIKQWLVEGEIKVLDWAKLILHFFNDPDLILDAFRGDLIEEVFKE
ncbi:hypothetical protein V7192_19145 [Bacillus safensis]|uniref:hypothetical protein n=1 Tax=Bacillus safensis TaxID=561879 RepID=UPI002FFEA836